MAERNPDGTFAQGHESKGGRPKKQYSITSMLREIGEEPTEDGKETRAQRLARVIWTDAESGNRDARKEIMDRLEGKPKERVEVEGETVVRIRFDDEGRSSTTAAETAGVLE